MKITLRTTLAGVLSVFALQAMSSPATAAESTADTAVAAPVLTTVGESSYRILRVHDTW